jgi:Transglutaminase-like superfamily
MPPGRAACFRAAIVVVLAVVGLAAPAGARPSGPVLHEPIPPDPREDLVMHVALEGDLPAALQTPGGIVGAPDPRALPRPSEASYGPGTERDAFVPDRETRRPDVGGYDDPFTPSTAPFKRREAFDGVRNDYRLYVHDERLVDVPSGAVPGPDDDAFYADLVADVDSDRRVRIPSVGPGARIVRAHLAAGPEDVPMRVKHDGADNWFLEVYRPRGPLRARLVMHVIVARAAFGGDLADVGWSDLPRIPALPESVARESALVRSAIGVSRKMRPRAAIAKLVEYFRGFSDSDEPPRGRGSIYLDLALSKKGVCRHRAFAFLVTAQGMGIPTRLIINEAHAWVEVHDGVLWRRIDLGGAGRMAPSPSDPAADRLVYEPPADGLAWPPGAQRGSEMMADARGASGPSAGGATSSNPPAGPAGSDPGRDPGRAPSSATSASSSASSRALAPLPPATRADSLEDRWSRPPSAVWLTVSGAEAHSGRPLFVRGEVHAEGEPCPHVAVDLWLRAAGTQKAFPLGTLASGDDGAFAGGIAIPSDALLGDYDVIARTAGDARCGSGSNE